MPKIARNEKKDLSLCHVIAIKSCVICFREIINSQERYLVQGWGKFDVFQLKSLSFAIKSTSRFYEKSMPSRRMSSNFRDSDLQSTLEIPAAYEIHMEDRNHGLA